MTVLARSYDQPSVIENQYQEVEIKSLWPPKSKRLESLVHTFIGVLYVEIKRPDVLYIHTVGSALMEPFANLLGLWAVMTHHGSGYVCQKWGGFAKIFYKFGDYRCTVGYQ